MRYEQLSSEVLSSTAPMISELTESKPFEAPSIFISSLSFTSQVNKTHVVLSLSLSRIPHMLGPDHMCPC